MNRSSREQGESASAQLGPVIPVSSVHTDQFEHFLKHQTVEYLCRGQVLFSIGEQDNATIYLLSGELSLVDSDGRKQTISAGTLDSWRPVAHHQPRQATAVALTDVSYISFDSYRFDTLLAWDQTAGYTVLDISSDRDLDDDAEWMIKLLQSELFYRIPPANISNIFKCFEPRAIKAGDVVFHQGEYGDSCYYIRSGEFAVEIESGGRSSQVAKLCEGSSFGEDALLTKTTRNATIRALSDANVMRLEKHQFDLLLKTPVVSALSFEEACERVKQGAVLMDVRLEEEYRAGHMEGCIHVPLHLMRLKMKLLDKKTAYIVYCDNCQRSTAATYLLSQAGFEVYLLSGGYLGVSN